MNTRWQLATALSFSTLVLITGSVAVSGHEGRSSRLPSPSATIRDVHSIALEIGERLGLAEDETSVAPGTLDDGEELLPKAQITLKQAIDAAIASASGPLGEVDLEQYNGTVVYNIDIGDKDVKVDASDGTVLEVKTDD